MEDDEKVTDDGDEDIQVETVEEPTEDDGPEEIKAKTEKLAAQNKFLREKLEGAVTTKKNWRTKYEQLLGEQPPSLSPNPTPPAEPEVVTRLSKLESAEEKRQFGHAKGLSPEETDHLFAYAKGMNLKPSEAMEAPFFKTALTELRKTSATNAAIPGPSARSPMVEGKTFRDMSPEERKKNFGKVVQGTPR